MRRLFVALGLMALAVFVCSPVWAQNNGGGRVAGTQAVIDLGANPSTSNFNSISACTGPGSAPFPADDSYVFTLTGPKRVTIGEADCCCIGDYYQASLNGNVVNTTPDPFAYCAAGTDPWGCVTGNCSPLSAGRTSVCLPAGRYHWTVTNPGFAGHSAAEIAAELMCPAGFTDTIDTSAATNCSCREAQLGVIVAVLDESTYRNHGQYVSAATAALAGIGATLSAECQSCIINQFARSVPQERMVSCAGL